MLVHSLVFLGLFKTHRLLFIFIFVGECQDTFINFLFIMNQRLLFVLCLVYELHSRCLESCEPSGCAASSSDYRCSLCKPGFYNSGNDCFPCPQECQTCTSATNCTTCRSPSSPGPVTASILGTCFQCAPTCLTCGPTVSACTTCISTFRLDT